MTATTITPTPEPAPLSEFERIIDTFIAPSKTFTDLLRSAAWWAPFLLLAVVSCAFVYVVDQKIGFSKVVDNQLQRRPSRRSNSSRCLRLTAINKWQCEPHGPGTSPTDTR
jgi:hypothetical protein